MPIPSINGVMIIPTGLGCSLGGDAAFNPGLKLIAGCCKKLVVNPNLCNASDINEQTPNCLYVEGSIIDRFLAGSINLKPVKTHNKILCVVNSPITPGSINAVNAGIWGLGAEIELLELTTPLIMKAHLNDDGTAGGSASGLIALIEQIKDKDFDALAIHTTIDCDEELANSYWEGDITVNPWGAIEAQISKYIASAIDKPVAHAPMDFLQDNLYNKVVVKPSQSPEIISNTYLFCVLKGLHQSPLIDLIKNPKNISNEDIDFLLTPHNCWGSPHISCLNHGIPIIVVMENTTCQSNFSYPEGIRGNKKVVFVENYLEAAGLIMCMNAGVSYKTVILG